MPIDTLNERLAVIGFRSGAIVVPPFADSVLDSEDSRQILGLPRTGDPAQSVYPLAVGGGGVGVPTVSQPNVVYPLSVGASGGVGQPSVIRGTGELQVDVSESFGSLESMSASQVALGENHFVLKDEIASMEVASLDAPFVYSLSQMQRALRGTPGTGHAIGDMFCLISEDIARISVDDSLVGQTVLFKCVSKYQSLGDVVAKSVVIQPKAAADVFVPDDIFVRLASPEQVWTSGDLTTGTKDVWSDWIEVDLSSAVPAGVNGVVVNVRMVAVRTGGAGNATTLGIEYKRLASEITEERIAEAYIMPDEDDKQSRYSQQAIIALASDRTCQLRYLQNGSVVYYNYVVKVVGYFKKP